MDRVPSSLVSSLLSSAAALRAPAAWTRGQWWRTSMAKTVGAREGYKGHSFVLVVASKLSAKFVSNFSSEAQSTSRKWHFMCVVNLGPDQIREVAPWHHGHKSRKSRESSLDIFLTFGLKAYQIQLSHRPYFTHLFSSCLSS